MSTLEAQGGEFEGVVAVVTGGSSGLGAAISQELASRGADVWTLDVQTPAEPSARVVHCDVSDTESVQSAIDRVVASAGRLDIGVANAGIGAQGKIGNNSDEEWLGVFEANVFGSVRVARSAMPHLERSPHGALVFTSSIAAATVLPDRVLYSASKGALNALTLALTADSLETGVRVNAVAPGTAAAPWVGRLLDSATDPEAERRALANRQLTGRLVSPEEVAGAVAYLASPRSGSTTGVVLAVDGGMQTLRPRPRAT